MAAHVRAGPVLVRCASELRRCHCRSSSLAAGVSPWRRAGAGGRLRARACVAAPPAAFGRRDAPRRDPASFRLFASGSGDPGESADDDGPRIVEIEPTGGGESGGGGGRTGRAGLRR